MKNKISIWTALYCLIIVVPLTAQNAKEIVRKSDELIRSKSSYSEISMKIIKPDWSREVQMKVWAIEPDFALVLLTAPARDKGNVTLKRKKEVWNYIPTIRRLIKIPPSMMLQDWMGSDFTNDDLVRQSSIVTDYDQKIEAREKVQGYECYKIEMIPRPEAGVVWGKVILWISIEGFMQMQAKYYDEDDILIKTMTGSNVQKLGGRVFPAHWEMAPINKPGQKTVMDYHTIEFNKKLNPRFFSQQNMKLVR